MDDQKLFLLVRERYSEKKYKICKNIINRVQKEHEKEFHPDASKTTKIDCIICGGTYTKTVKCLHDRTKMHQKKVKELCHFAFIEPSK